MIVFFFRLFFVFLLLGLIFLEERFYEGEIFLGLFSRLYFETFLIVLHCTSPSFLSFGLILMGRAEVEERVRQPVVSILSDLGIVCEERLAVGRDGCPPELGFGCGGAGSEVELGTSFTGGRFRGFMKMFVSCFVITAFVRGFSFVDLPEFSSLRLV